MILVTGGTGFIGTHLLERLVANREAVRALVRRTRLPRVLPAGVETVYGDLESGTGIADALRGADAVIHLAGVTKALRTYDFYSGNVRATEQLVHSMAGQGIRLVHVSSLAAIGPSTAGFRKAALLTRPSTCSHGNWSSVSRRCDATTRRSSFVPRPPQRVRSGMWRTLTCSMPRRGRPSSPIGFARRS